MDQLKVRSHIEAGAQRGDGACLIAYAILELARVQSTFTADDYADAGVGGKIVKAVESVADRLAEIGDTILCK